jgi:hypothetical protein
LRMEAPNKPQICLQDGTRYARKMKYTGTSVSARRYMSVCVT